MKHVPLSEQPALIRRIADWLQPDGVILATVGEHAWSGSEQNWLGKTGGTMAWSHTDVATYRRWFEDAGLVVEREEFVPEGAGGHRFIQARKVRE